MQRIKANFFIILFLNLLDYLAFYYLSIALMLTNVSLEAKSMAMASITPSMTYKNRWQHIV
jgi:hypothetical protein